MGIGHYYLVYGPFSYSYIHLTWPGINQYEGGWRLLYSIRSPSLDDTFKVLPRHTLWWSLSVSQHNSHTSNIVMPCSLPCSRINWHRKGRLNKKWTGFWFSTTVDWNGCEYNSQRYLCAQEGRNYRLTRRT